MFACNRHVQLGVVVDGWPIAHQVFLGDWRDFEMVKGDSTRRGVTGGSNRAREVLWALGITTLAPPQASETA